MFNQNEILAQASMVRGYSTDTKGLVKDHDPQCEIHKQIEFLLQTLNELHNRISSLSERLVPIRVLADEVSEAPNVAPAKTQIGEQIQNQALAVMKITRMVNDILNEIQI